MVDTDVNEDIVKLQIKIHVLKDLNYIVQTILL